MSTPLTDNAQFGTGRVTVDFARRLELDRAALMEALEKLLRRDMMNTCQHENTHRGGAIWTICDQCDAHWADDHGGMPEWEDPSEWVLAQSALSTARANFP